MFCLIFLFGRCNTIKEASIKLDICYSSIKSVLCKTQNTDGGFIFKYLD